MLNISTGELLVVALIALIVLGPERLPNAARQAGRALAELRRVSNGFQDELRMAMREPPPTLPPLPPAASTPTSEAGPAKRTRREAPLRSTTRPPAVEQLSADEG